MRKTESVIAKPFLKWAGGKTQLIPQIENALPTEIINRPFTYIEPFVGSGAILFWMLSKFPQLKHAVINDINADLVNTYRIIASKPKEIISILLEMQNQYHAIDKNEDSKKEYYYQKRDLFNTRATDKSTQAAFYFYK